jgi:hypothetical protein
MNAGEVIEAFCRLALGGVALGMEGEDRLVPTAFGAPAQLDLYSLLPTPFSLSCRSGVGVCDHLACGQDSQRRFDGDYSHGFEVF